MRLCLVILLLTSLTCLAQGFAPPNTAEWELINTSAIGFKGKLYKNKSAGAARFIVTRELSVRSPEFFEVLGKSLDTVEAGRAHVLKYFGISKYRILKQSGDKSKHLLHSEYLDPNGKTRHMIEHQYVKDSKAYILSYVVEQPSLNEEDLKRIDDIINELRPRLLASFFFWLNSAEAETFGKSEGPVLDSPKSGGFNLPEYCNEVPEADRRKPNEPDILPVTDPSFAPCLEKLAAPLKLLD